MRILMLRMANGDALSLRIQRLGPGDRDAARALFEVMAIAFEEDREPLNDAYVDGLVARRDLWVVVAWQGAAVVGGLTAHVLPMTRSASTELFIYDLAVHPAYQRRGVGRGLISFLRERARAEGHGVIFVPADDEDTHALEFYRAVGGVGAPVTIFTFDE
ncbi:MAG: GNAT family N-acetyltransferase [Deltaproteobacteria bacterium]|nr:GNAT family N-acetyltransferase [Deltaproteobacteria bacterium]